MDNRDAIVKEYFKLRVLLNRGNKVRDERTEIVFVIREAQGNLVQFVATLIGKDRPTVELCTNKPNDRWDWSGSSGLKTLEEFCAARLQQHQDKMGVSNPHNLTELQKEWLCEQISNELRSLGITKDKA